ncbi:HVA22-like protein f [Bidens hawaiensis]|uniref:HVA22-like protein f n=1 Tax=Bidens hawaiensis TaxID=980011 RepID=UPI00404A101B
MGLLATIGGYLNTLIGPGITLLFPLYTSILAIKGSASEEDDKKWLTYWVLYSFITLFELFFWKALQWFPSWPYLKSLFCLWLMLPGINGTSYVYANIVRKYVVAGSHLNSKYWKLLQMMSQDARRSVECCYIDTWTRSI